MVQTVFCFKFFEPLRKVPLIKSKRLNGSNKHIVLAELNFILLILLRTLYFILSFF
jgi:hypothetical protein